MFHTFNKSSYHTFEGCLTNLLFWTSLTETSFSLNFLYKKIYKPKNFQSQKLSPPRCTEIIRMEIAIPAGPRITRCLRGLHMNTRWSVWQSEFVGTIRVQVSAKALGLTVVGQWGNDVNVVGPEKNLGTGGKGDLNWE